MTVAALDGIRECLPGLRRLFGNVCHILDPEKLAEIAESYSGCGIVRVDYRNGGRNHGFEVSHTC
jgi:hypothetical protein